MTSNFCCVILLAYFLFSLVNADGSVEVCRSDLGHMDISPDTKFVMPIHEPNNVHTIFVHSFPTYSFECTSHDAAVPVAISFMKRPINVTDDLYKNVVASSDLRSETMSFENAVNRKNMSVICHSADQLVCEINLIVIAQEDPDCQVNNALSCNVSSWIGQINANKNGFIESRSRFSMAEEPFHPIIKYSFFDSVIGQWKYCNEVDGQGTTIGISTHSENSTQTIQCPITLSNDPRPIIIRIEQTKMNSLTVALPILNNNSNKPTFTYFSVLVNSTLSVESVDPGSGTITIVAICLAILLAGLLAITLIFFIRRKMCIHKGGSKFYADIKLVDAVSSKDKDCHRDDYSMTTETTTAYDRVHLAIQDMDANMDTKSFLEMFQSDELGHLDLKTLLRRQLSGDPSKLNPNLSLNQQVNALAYNPKLEIDRSNFSVGQILGSGHFGSVFVGVASGLFHPGSETKVAIKTVHDSLDLAQFSALLCEMKILTNLDLHLNLVNLLGSCTSEMDQAKLWLLLEFCPNGDLKTFLIRNREQLKNNIRGLVATELDVRIFLKWAHSIAKGMEYLSSRKIMHGDLAARNVMLGSNLVAKVGDFGLSKSMYDNIRYKKQSRNYVPWKWMALEYLTDACFTLKSDVWSYGIVLWEMFSLGQEPYMAQKVEEVLEQIKQGHRLSLPDEVCEIEWAQQVFEKVMRPSWTADPDDRCSFGDIVSQVETLLDADETLEYQEMGQQYDSMRRLMFDDLTVSKRNTLSPRTSFLPPGSYHKFVMPRVPINGESATDYITVQDAQSKSDEEEAEYVESNKSGDSTVSSSSNYLSLSEAQNGHANAIFEEEDDNEDSRGSEKRGGYVSLDVAKNLETVRSSPVSNGRANRFIKCSATVT